MTLKELKKMVAEEYAAYKKTLKEQGDMPGMPPMPPGGPGVTVSDDDVDAMGGGDAESTLKDIFDMLKDYFEGGGSDEGDDMEPAAGDEDDADADDADADADDEEDEEELEENSKITSGYKSIKESKASKKKAFIKAAAANKKFIAEKKQLNESNRLKKLANIIK
jgi:hypothetical protein